MANTIELGTLKIISPTEGAVLLGPPVAAALARMPVTEVGISEIDPTLSDTAAFCAHYQVGMDQAANCVILEAKRADRTWLAACIVLGNMRADVNGAARRILNARRVSFASMDRAVTETGMEYGAITPVGLPAAWPILIDTAVINSPYVVIGSGIRKSKLVVPGSFLASLPNAQVVERLAQTPHLPT